MYMYLYMYGTCITVALYTTRINTSWRSCLELTVTKMQQSQYFILTTIQNNLHMLKYSGIVTK